MPAPYLPTAIANHFIVEYGDTLDGICHMKLQKLTYLAYGWWLAVRGMDAQRLTTEPPEVWRHGPVFNGMYKAFGIYGGKPIREPQSCNPLGPDPMIDREDSHTRSFLAWIWKRYGSLHAIDLSALAHRVDGAWYRTATDHDFLVERHTSVSDHHIYDEFATLLPEWREILHNRKDRDHAQIL